MEFDGSGHKTIAIQYFDSTKGSRSTAKAPRAMTNRTLQNMQGQGKSLYRYSQEMARCAITDKWDGLWVCQYAERFVRKAHMNFFQEDMVVTKIQMSHEILTGKRM